MHNDTYPAGRYWGSADKAELTTDQDGAVIRLSWNDGKYVVVEYNQSASLGEADARDMLRRLGWDA